MASYVLHCRTTAAYTIVTSGSSSGGLFGTIHGQLDTKYRGILFNKSDGEMLSLI